MSKLEKFAEEKLNELGVTYEEVLLLTKYNDAAILNWYAGILRGIKNERDTSIILYSKKYIEHLLKRKMTLDEFKEWQERLYNETMLIEEIDDLIIDFDEGKYNK